MNIMVAHNPTHVYHNLKGSPESPERIESVYKYLKMKLQGKIEFLEVREPADLEEVLAVHTPQYLEFLERMSMRGNTYLGDSTYLNNYSYMAALIAAETSIEASDAVIRADHDLSYALIRPPGHHASADMYGGYCLLNNAAITAKHVMERGLRKIAIIDWDAHAANGTMKIFYPSKDVLLISIHRDPSDFYPHEGFIHQIGRGEGTGYTVNIPVPKGTGDVEYRMIFDEIIDPIIKDFNPDFIIGENGFDPHYSERGVGLSLTIGGFVDIVKRLKSYGKMFMLVQEGGYNPKNKDIAYAMLSSLLGEGVEVENYNMSERLTAGNRVRKEVEETINKLKFIFGDYFDVG